MGIILIPDENQVNRNLQQRIIADEERQKFNFEMAQLMLTEMFTKAALPTIDLLPYFKRLCHR